MQRTGGAAMTNPITPPPELVRQWTDLWYATNDKGPFSVYVSTMAAQYGADQELEACCEWTHQDSSPEDAASLRAARRPKSPSLKEQALEALFAINDPLGSLPPHHYNTIRRALEQLND